jgi:hypothetical protein
MEFRFDKLGLHSFQFLRFKGDKMRRFMFLSILFVSFSPLLSYSQITATVTKSSITVKWVAPKKITVTTYNIYRASEADGKYILIGTRGSQYRLFKDTTVVSRTEYWYYVTDTVNNVESIPSNVAEATAK